MRNITTYSFFFLLTKITLAQKIANYVTNGDFEKYIYCNNIPFYSASGWRPIDSAYYSGIEYYNACNSLVPFDGSCYQTTHSGNGMSSTTFICFSSNCGIEATRGYFRNRLKSNLLNGMVYCVKFYVNIRDISSHGIDGFGACFINDIIDTIKKPTIPLTYLYPQVSNPNGNIITDTMNWTAISGTFIATGIEKHVVIGNFKSDANTSKVFINPVWLPYNFCDVYLDDVSCIPLNLSAYAGPDKSCKIGDSVYIGRESDFAIDPGCTWYKLPNMATPFASSVSGLWVKPVVTTSYVVKQILDCSALKWDTVVVFADLLSLESLESLESLKVRVQGSILKIEGLKVQDGLSVQIYDALGKLIFTKEKVSDNEVYNFSGQQSGVYIVQLSSASSDSYRTSLSMTGVLRKKIVYVAEE